MAHPRPDTSVVKRCSGCKETLPREMFGPDKLTFDKLRAYCRPCQVKRHDKWRRKNLAKAAANGRKWRANNPRLAKDHTLRSRYGIPLGTYDRLLAEQGGRCAICGSSDPGGRGDFHVDHCHDSKTVRGLLCHNCNVSIGHFKHDTKVILSAISYIDKYSSEGRSKG